MATETVSRLEPEPFDFEDEGHHMTGLLALANWVEGARHVLARVEALAELDGTFRDRLQASGIPYVVPWEEPESAGLCSLFSVTRRTARVMSEAAMELSQIQRASKGVAHG